MTTSELFWETYRSKTKGEKSLYFFLSSVSVAECSLNERNLELRAKPCGPDLKSLNEILGYTGE